MDSMHSMDFMESIDSMEFMDSRDSMDPLRPLADFSAEPWTLAGIFLLPGTDSIYVALYAALLSIGDSDGEKCALQVKLHCILEEV